jgi:hypothetical protein
MIKLTGICLLLLAQAQAMDEKKENIAAPPPVMVETKETNKAKRPQTAPQKRTMTRQVGKSNLCLDTDVKDGVTNDG